MSVPWLLIGYGTDASSNQNVNITGVSGTGSAGTILFQSATVNITGVSGTGQAGSINFGPGTEGQTVLMPGGSLSRERYRKIKREIEAEIAKAEAKARKLNGEAKAALQDAAEVAQEVVSRGLLEDYKPLVVALEAAVKTKTQTESLSLKALAVAEEMLRRQDEDEEDVMILTWAI